MHAMWLAGALLAAVPGALPDAYDLPTWAPCAEILWVRGGKPLAVDPTTGAERPRTGCGDADWAVWGPSCGACTFFRRSKASSESGRLVLCREGRPPENLLAGEVPGQSQFVWSASGRWLLQNTRSGGKWSLEIVDGTTGARERIPPPSPDLLPPALPGEPPPAPQMGSFSPDDRRVYFSLVARGGAYDGERGLWRYDRETKRTTRVLRGGWCLWPSVSPRGDWIAYLARDARSAETRYDLWLVEPEGAQAVRLTSDPSISCQGRPAWSPDGKRIAVCVQTGRSLPVLSIASPRG